MVQSCNKIHQKEKDLKKSFAHGDRKGKMGQKKGENLIFLCSLHSIFERLGYFKELYYLFTEMRKETTKSSFKETTKVSLHEI